MAEVPRQQTPPGDIALLHKRFKQASHLMRSTVESVTQALQDTNQKTRIQAVKALGSIGQGAPANVVPMVVHALQEALHDQDAYVRSLAAQGMGGIGKAAPAKLVPVVVDALSDVLHRKHEDAISDAVKALGRIGQAAPANVLPVASAFASAGTQSESEGVRKNVIAALGDLGKDAPSEVLYDVFMPFLKDALQDTNEKIRNEAIEAWGKVGQVSPVGLLPLVVEALYTGVTDACPVVRRTAVDALDNIGDTAPAEALEAMFLSLCRALRDDDSEILVAAAMALGKICRSTEKLALAMPGMEEKVVVFVVNELTQALSDSENPGFVRSEVAGVLCNIGKSVPPPISHRVANDLLQAQHDDDPAVRVKVCEALVGLGA